MSAGILVTITIISVCIIIAFLFIILTKTSSEGRAKSSILDGYQYAHRGLFDNDAGIYENTLEAFTKAFEKGYGAELDVHLTSDGELVVYHDSNLKRLCGVDREIEKMTCADLSEIRVCGTGRIPTLEEILNINSSKAPLIVEIKAKDNVDSICKKAMEILKEYKGVYCVESFNPGVVRWFYKNAPLVVRGQLGADFMKSWRRYGIVKCFMETNLLWNIWSKPDFVAYEVENIGNVGLLVCRKIWKSYLVGWTTKSSVDFDKFKKIFDIQIFEGFS